MLQKELTLIKQVRQKNVSFATIGFLKMLDSNLKNMFVIAIKNIAILSAKEAIFRCLLIGISNNKR